MKNNYLKLLFINIYLLLFAFFSLFIAKSFNYYLYLFVLAASALVIYKLIKTERKRERFNTELFLIIIISVIFFNIVTYFIGFFSGFYYTTYSKTLTGIMRNISLALILFTSIEMIREKLIKSGKEYKLIIILTFLTLSLLELPSIINFRLLTTPTDILTAVVSIIIPIFTKNIFLIYCTYTTGFKNSFTYQLLTSIPNYLLPVFPNLGDYFTDVFNILLPIILIVIAINLNILKREKITNSRQIKKKAIFERVFIILIASLTIIMMYLTSGIFRFISLAIGSESMTGAIDKGDVVIIDKKDKNINEKDIIAFKQNEKIIVHRVTKVLDKEKGIYKTKGDFNKSEDSWIVEEGQLVGTVKLNIKYLGWPTIKLSELLAKK